MKKRPYRATRVNDLDVQALQSRLKDQRVIVGVDVAKVDFVATLMNDQGENIVTVKWKHPEETMYPSETPTLEHDFLNPDIRAHGKNR